VQRGVEQGQHDGKASSPRGPRRELSEDVWGDKVTVTPSRSLRAHASSEQIIRKIHGSEDAIGLYTYIWFINRVPCSAQAPKTGQLLIF